MRVPLLDEGAQLRDGRYEVVSLKRATPVKQVYKARDRSLDHAVVIDVVSEDSGAAYESIAWEARILGRLGGHPNIATVQDYWEAEGAAFMVSRYFERGSLQDLIGRSTERGNPLSIDEILQFSVQLAGALEHVH
jgi:non-specific serine/threonine protein kinase